MKLYERGVSCDAEIAKVDRNSMCYVFMSILFVFYVAPHTAAGFIIPVIRKGRTRRAIK
jgi:hypothetical protein